MVPFLYQDLRIILILVLIRKILQPIVKPEVWSGRDLKKIDLLDKNTFLKYKYINIGFAAIKGPKPVSWRKMIPFQMHK